MLPSPEFLIAGAMLISLLIYALTAGADFGGGVWDLFARGPRKQQQRDLISHAIGPVWEANHVWLILAVVILFFAFPPAFALLMTTLHIPLTIMLIGIVLRGSAFTFRTYDDQRSEVQRRWGRIFAGSSIFTPVMLGICLGAIASGRAGRNYPPTVGTQWYFDSWVAPFPFAIGLFTLTLFAFLAAVYLTVETADPELQEDFRRRALAAAAACGVMALIAILLAARDAPELHAGLTRSWWSLPFHIVTGLVAVAAIVTLWHRHFRTARVLAAAQVTLIVSGWAVDQYPLLIPPALAFNDAAAAPHVLRFLVGALLAGLVVLVPSMWLLFRIFKADRQPSGADHDSP